MESGWLQWFAATLCVFAFAHGCASDDSDTDGGPVPVFGEPDEIDWRTSKSFFKARRFSIEAGGTTFVVGDEEVSVSGDYIPEEYATIEASWFEHSVEMRLYVYLRSDGVDWWADEIRTYDGTSPGEWIEYAGEWFRSPVGHAHVGDLHLETPVGAPIPGRVDVDGLLVRSFIEPDCMGADFTLRSWALVVDIPLSPTAGFRNLVDVLDSSCSVIDDLTPFELVWELEDPIATVEWDGVGWDFQGVALGETLAHLRLHDLATGDVLAETAVPVVVYEP